ncbi:MAG: ABC transporter permease subunit [Holosporales bacterium]|jgi:putrescine transport system permease protein|nr:ABC transporter permease subunit [Holosporales bacterium]
MLLFGYAFMYVPLFCIIALSFNDSRFVTAWSHFSFKWYKALAQNSIMLDAALNSLKIACCTATISVLIGTLAAIAIVRVKRFKGKPFFVGMIAAPLIMPDVVVGLSLLLLFVSMTNLLGWPGEHGILTVTIAHITLSLSYVTAVIQSRLTEMDSSIEEAALDLGATPVKVFFAITIPSISSAIMSGWILSFVLSFDDVVLASFVSGPQSTTLPMVVFSSIRMGLSPQINAMTTIIVSILTVCVAIAGYVIYHSGKKISNKPRQEKKRWQGLM